MKHSECQFQHMFRNWAGDIGVSPQIMVTMHSKVMISVLANLKLPLVHLLIHTSVSPETFSMERDKGITVGGGEYMNKPGDGPLSLYSQ